MLSAYSQTKYELLKLKIPYLNTENTRAIFPMARILFRITSLRKLAALPVDVCGVHNWRKKKNNIKIKMLSIHE